MPQEQKPSVNQISRQIGGTTYEVHINFNEKSKENVNDKIKRIIKSQIEKRKAFDVLSSNTIFLHIRLNGRMPAFPW